MDCFRDSGLARLLRSSSLSHSLVGRLCLLVWSDSLGPKQSSLAHFFSLRCSHSFWAAQCIGTTNDSPGYVEAVSEFFREGQPGYFPPGYPALLGLVGSLSGDNLGKWVTLIQHGMVVLGAVWIHLLLRG